MKKLYTTPKTSVVKLQTEGIIAMSNIQVNQVGTDAEPLTNKRNPWEADAWMQH